ncbi:hypothetical protein E4U53_005934 [Claviceps sorghi]|nr:hypothetical protein E4U53_005934 [Claviceps sorghi]
MGELATQKIRGMVDVNANEGSSAAWSAEAREVVDNKGGWRNATGAGVCGLVLVVNRSPKVFGGGGVAGEPRRQKPAPGT